MLLVAGALSSGLPPWSAYPFLGLMALLVLFPLSSDPLEKIPAERLALWPLLRRHRIALRGVSLILNPVLWVALWAGLAPGMILVAAALVKARVPETTIVRLVPMFRGRLGGLITCNLRGLLSVLDTWLAILLSLGATAYRLFGGLHDADAFRMMALLVALALSTYTQSLFGLDYGSGTTLYRLLPLKGWQILAAKDIAWLAVLIVLTATLSLPAALAFGFTALATGHHSSVLLHLPQKRWRFAGGRLLPVGALQILLSMALGFNEMLLPAAALYAASLWFYGRRFESGAKSTTQA
jgi:hypothetical protein